MTTTAGGRVIFGHLSSRLFITFLRPAGIVEPQVDLSAYANVGFLWVKFEQWRCSEYPELAAMKTNE